jgi:2-(1,2-epoxy-1,2-dihydrophenyl)acetyl-CoA isomerase
MTEAHELIVVAGDEVTTITLNRPHRLNALTDKLLRGLVEAIAEAGNRSRVVVLRGEGRAFSSGHDLKQPALTTPADAEASTELLHGVTRAVRASPAPVIAQVHGYAVGGGAEIALTCDLVVAATSATFLFTETAIGLSVTNGFTELLPRATGPVVAKEIVMLGQPIDAHQARAWGLITRVVAEDELEQTTMQLVKWLLEKSPNALRLAKRLINAGAEDSVTAAMARETLASVEATLSEDAREAAAAFAERREPRFRV